MVSEYLTPPPPEPVPLPAFFPDATPYPLVPTLPFIVWADTPACDPEPAPPPPLPPLPPVIVLLIPSVPPPQPAPHQ